MLKMWEAKKKTNNNKNKTSLDMQKKKRTRIQLDGYISTWKSVRQHKTAYAEPRKVPTCRAVNISPDELLTGLHIS